MRLHLLEHDPYDFSRTNITIWAEKRGYELHQTYICRNERLPSLDDQDWLMVMGGSQHVWEEEAHPWLVEEKAFIRKAMERGKPVLGICFGAQLIAEILGAEIFPNTHKEIGWHEVQLTAEGKKSFLLRNIPDRFTSFHWHSDHFSLPPGCTRLARSTPTPNQAFICKDWPIVGLQFHPEYTREMVTFFANREGDEWAPDPFVSGKEKVLRETGEIQETYWLMETLLENMEAALKHGWVGFSSALAGEEKK
ncbi:MAG: amidotransferase [Deltaproteobacteria bacterium]|nr:MAG: amidotransferase [Deltaproteobacteria bacterium]